MARISNVDKAYKQIEEKAKAHQGVLTADVYQIFLRDASVEFNLDEIKINQLSNLKFTRPIDLGAIPDETINKDKTPNKEIYGLDLAKSSNSNSYSAKEPSETPTLEEAITTCKELKSQIDNMELALAKIATLTGYSNYLREFNLKPWVPGKKDIGKNYG